MVHSLNISLLAGLKWRVTMWLGSFLPFLINYGANVISYPRFFNSSDSSVSVMPKVKPLIMILRVLSSGLGKVWKFASIVLKYFWTILNILPSTHWIFTRSFLKALTLIDSAGAMIISFGATFLHMADGVMVVEAGS